jgi:hypothetical protein
MDKEYNVAIQRLQMPTRLKKLRVSENGFPVPKFVMDVDGKPDFRVINRAFMSNAVRLKLCWLCGEALGRYQAFVVGPMCVISGTNSEPPSHLECAQFAAKACPFLTQPNRKRNEQDLPADAEQPAGEPLARNPGVCAVMVTTDYRQFRAKGGVLFEMGPPVSIEWYCHGRAATRDEVMASINSGLPVLEKLARQESPRAVAEFERRLAERLELVPA